MKKFLILCVLLTGCQPHVQHSNVLLLKGSSTMLPMARAWAEAFMLEHPGISVYTEGGGTAKGAAELARGRIDFCMASRPLRPNEARLLAENFNTVGMAVLVAKDALSIYLNPLNPVKSLSMSQLERIYSGDITHWNQVGGEPESIKLIHRLPNSGTFLYFKDHVLSGRPYAQTGIKVMTNQEMISVVSQHINAIGYGGAAYGDNVRHCPINNIPPTAEKVANDSYPITRYLYLYSINTPRGLQKLFVDWVLSETGQDIVRKSGYFPIWNRGR